MNKTRVKSEVAIINLPFSKFQISLFWVHDENISKVKLQKMKFQEWKKIKKRKKEKRKILVIGTN